jgi:hypothetical protein
MNSPATATRPPAPANSSSFPSADLTSASIPQLRATRNSRRPPAGASDFRFIMVFMALYRKVQAPKNAPQTGWRGG